MIVSEIQLFVDFNAFTLWLVPANLFHFTFLMIANILRVEVYGGSLNLRLNCNLNLKWILNLK